MLVASRFDEDYSPSIFREYRCVPVTNGFSLLSWLT